MRGSLTVNRRPFSKVFSTSLARMFSGENGSKICGRPDGSMLRPVPVMAATTSWRVGYRRIFIANAKSSFLLSPLPFKGRGSGSGGEKNFLRGHQVSRPPIDIGRPLRAFPVTPPGVRVRTRRFGWLSYHTGAKNIGSRMMPGVRTHATLMMLQSLHRQPSGLHPYLWK